MIYFYQHITEAMGLKIPPPPTMVSHFNLGGS